MSFHALKALRNPKYLKFVRSRPCIVTGTEGDNVIAHHVRCLGGGGMGLKPADYLCIPLDAEEHARLHAMGEDLYWQRKGIDPCAMIGMTILVYLAQDLGSDGRRIAALIEWVHSKK